MAEDQQNKPVNSKLSDLPGWQLRSPGRARPAPATPEPQPEAKAAPAPEVAKSAPAAPKPVAKAPQQIRIEKPVAAEPPAKPDIETKPATPRFPFGQRELLDGILSRVFKKSNVWAAVAASMAGVSLVAIFASRNTVPLSNHEPPVSGTAPASLSDGKIVMGTGPAYNSPSEILPRSYAGRKAASAPEASADDLDNANQIARRFTKKRTISPDIQNLIQEASAREGLHPELMVYLFGKESGFNERARSDTGATGLCQFTEQSFLAAMNKHGHRLGLGNYANQIDSYYSRRLDRTYLTAHRNESKILAMRKDPEVAIPLCAAHIKDDLVYLQSQIRRPLTFADSALAHFTGAVVAKDLIRAYANPTTRKSPAFEYAEPINYQGRTNRRVFFRGGDRDRPYSVEQLYMSKVRVMGTTPAFAADSSRASKAAAARLTP